MSDGQSDSRAEMESGGWAINPQPKANIITMKTLPERYQAWCGLGCPESLADMIGRKRNECVVVWPIVDKQTCGDINGEPTPKQWMAVAFTPAQQGEIVRALNAGALSNTEL